MSDADPLWYKDAIIYEVHVRAFHDSDGDGIGDFGGLTREARLSARPGRHGHLAAAVLSVAAAGRRLRHRRLHRRPSALRHAGRFPGVSARGASPRPAGHHRAGAEPHLRPASLVPASAARAGRAARERDFYVWSDTPEKYREARIIFKDFETSNWTWDPVAKAYYWHRFYSHQPDLNFDNPQVREAIFTRLSISGSDLGVDGLRLDAVPYLYEREGTNCENLPETHAFLRSLRAHVDAEIPQPHAAGRSQPVARRRRRLFRRRATNATWRFISR